MLLLEEYRGELLENTHYGRICVVDENSKVVYDTGQADTMTYFRSCAKPLQLLPLFDHGLDKKYGLTQDELTVCASSHLGEDIHINALESIMKKTGLKEDYLIVKPDIPWHNEARIDFNKKGLPKRKLYHNCSGKHFALMLLERELNGSHKDYWKPDSIAQQQVLKVIGDVAEFEVSKIIWGIDGCGVPVFAVPLKNIALSFMKLGSLKRSDRYEGGLEKLRESIALNPYMIRGRGAMCSEINSLGNFVGKIGAEGVYAFGLKKERLGVAIKLEDGTLEAFPIIISELLRQLKIKDDAVYSLLDKLKSPIKFNHNNDQIGIYKPVFKPLTAKN